MTSSQPGHFDYTLNEWTNEHFRKMLSIIFSDESVKNFIDLGANTGGVIKVLEHLGYVKKLDKIVCFEPDLANFNFLVNICNNIECEVICNNIGIYYGQTEACVWGGGDGNVGGYFINTGRSMGGGNFVQYPGKVFKLDTAEKYIDFDIDVLKIDVEGAEINIFENSTILKTAKYIILEWHFEVDEVPVFVKTNLENFDIIHSCVPHNHNFLLKNRTR